MNSPRHTEIGFEDKVCEMLKANGRFFNGPLPYEKGYAYDKLLRDAKRRSRPLFDKLGLHKH